MQNSLIFRFISLGLILLCFSCDKDRLKTIDISDIEIEEVKINRMENDIFSIPSDSMGEYTNKLVKKYGVFYIHYIKGFINNGGISDSSYLFNLQSFIADTNMLKVYNDCRKTFPDLHFLEKDFTDAFKRYKYFFPDKHLPRMVSLITGFNYSIVYADSTLGIGLDMYLGSKNRFYDMLSPDILPQYRRRTMNQQFIVPDGIRGWISLEFPSKIDKKDFLGEIINTGKTMYLTDALLPYVNDTLKIGYTLEQLEWCKKNEFNMWAFFIENRILFTTDQNEIMKYTTDGPFTSAFNKQSPSRVGHWIGWQIIRAYMKNNPDITLQQLMKEGDAQKILNLSKYKPNK